MSKFTVVDEMDTAIQGGSVDLMVEIVADGDGPRFADVSVTNIEDEDGSLSLSAKDVQKVYELAGRVLAAVDRSAADKAWDESGRSALDEMFEAITPSDGSMPDAHTAAMLAPHAWAEIKRLRAAVNPTPEGSNKHGG